MVDVKKLLSGRDALGEYQRLHAISPPEKQPELHQAMLSKLNELGFESLEAFLDFNEFANRVEKLICYETIGECNGCPGKPRGCDPNCLEQWVDKAAWKKSSYNRDRKTINIQQTRAVFDQKLKDGTLSLDFFRRSSSATFWSFKNFPGNVPPGCSVKIVKIAEPRFDLYWGMEWRTRILDPESYQRIMQRWQL